MPDSDGIPAIDAPVLMPVASPDRILEDNETRPVLDPRRLLGNGEIVDADTPLLDEVGDSSDDIRGVEETIVLEERVKGIADVKGPEIVEEFDSEIVDCSSGGGGFLP